jgi:hypothetical protein
MTSLEQISLQGNNLMFTMIPSSFKNLCNLKNTRSRKYQHLRGYHGVDGPALTYLVLATNKLTGPIPQWIWALSELVILELAGNKLNGIVTEDHLKGLTDLKFLALDNTLLQIKISPNWIPPFRLQAIILASLQLGPAFPSWLSHRQAFSSFTFQTQA